MRFKLTFLVLAIVSAASPADSYCLIDGVVITDDATAGTVIGDPTSTSAPCATCPLPDADGNVAASDAAVLLLQNQAIIDAQMATPTTTPFGTTMPTATPTPTPSFVGPTPMPTSTPTSTPWPTYTPMPTPTNTRMY